MPRLCCRFCLVSHARPVPSPLKTKLNDCRGYNPAFSSLLIILESNLRGSPWDWDTGPRRAQGRRHASRFLARPPAKTLHARSPDRRRRPGLSSSASRAVLHTHQSPEKNFFFFYSNTEIIFYLNGHQTTAMDAGKTGGLGFTGQSPATTVDRDVTPVRLHHPQRPTAVYGAGDRRLPPGGDPAAAAEARPTATAAAPPPNTKTKAPAHPPSPVRPP